MRWTPLLSIAVLGAALTLPARAESPAVALTQWAEPGDACGRPHPPGLHAGFAVEIGAGPAHGPGGPPLLEAPLPPYLRAVTLSDDQQDRIFDLLHAQAPQMRQLVRRLHRSHEQLRDLGLSDKYDEATARTLVAAGSKDEAELALLRTRTDHEILAVLTTEQRRQVAADAPGPDHSGNGGPGGCWH